MEHGWDTSMQKNRCWDFASKVKIAYAYNNLKKTPWSQVWLATKVDMEQRDWIVSFDRQSL